jgi:hypothetical protein
MRVMTLVNTQWIMLLLLFMCSLLEHDRGDYTTSST